MDAAVVGIRIGKAVFWGNQTDVSSVLALLERFVMTVFFYSGVVSSFGSLLLSQSFCWAPLVTWSNKQFLQEGKSHSPSWSCHFSSFTSNLLLAKLVWLSKSAEVSNFVVILVVFLFFGTKMVKYQAVQVKNENSCLGELKGDTWLLSYIGYLSHLKPLNLTLSCLYFIILQITKDAFFIIHNLWK